MVEGTFFFMHASCACCHTIIYGHTIHTVETAPKCINMLKSKNWKRRRAIISILNILNLFDFIS